MAIWAHAHGIHRFYHVPQHPDTASLIKQEWIFKDLVVMLDGNILWNQGEVLHDDVHALNQSIINNGFFLHSQYSWVRESRVEMGVASFTIILNDPLAKILLPFSANRGSDNPEVLAPKGEKFPLRDITRIH